jgi:predicted nucleic acid-binding protein
MARRRPVAHSQRLILDSGAVIALSRGDALARAHLAQALELQLDVRIPVVVLAETLRGGAADAAVHRVRNAADVLPATEPTGRLAGALLGQSGGTNTVDALVAAETVLAAADVLTSDAGDLRKLLAGHPEVSVIAI